MNTAAPPSGGPTGSEADVLSTHQKAFAINMDSSKYGTIAEIGAGQEVSRWFFRVGGASGTIAKTMSAYDMKVSDAIYGRCPRYVSRERLASMIDHEYSLLMERLSSKKGREKSFFVFADTVAASSYARQSDGLGWLGVRFQHEPGAPPSEIVIHVRMLDWDNVQQQEVLGILGVNLIYGAYYLHADPKALIQSLGDNLSANRFEIDLCKLSGAAFEDLDNRLLCLYLVEQGLGHITMFRADGEVVEPSEVLYRRPILIERGTFRPVTKASVNMLECGLAQFSREPKVGDKEAAILLEMTMSGLRTDKGIDPEDFLIRVDMLRSLGHDVVITGYFEFYRLAAHLFRYTKEMIGIVMGIPTLRQIFDQKYYTHLEGGILESFGRLFKNDLKLYVYPYRAPGSDQIVTVENLDVNAELRPLYDYLTGIHRIDPIRGYREEYLDYFSSEVLEKIRAGDPSWEVAVPENVVEIIKKRALLGYSQ